MRQLAASAIADGQPLAWYEQVYAQDDAVPWDHGEPTPFLVEWLPPQLHHQAALGIPSLCAPDGTILVVGRVPTPADPPGPPWLLTEDEVRQVAHDGVEMVNLERLPMRGGDRWVAGLTRPLH